MLIGVIKCRDRIYDKIPVQRNKCMNTLLPH
jgi:hypothetical protein